MRPPPLRPVLESLAARGQLTGEGLLIGLRRLACLPDAKGWQRFADRLLLALGSLLILSGMVFFFAYNWHDLHRYAKIGLVAIPLTECAVIAWRLDAENLAGQAWLGGAAVLTGVLLAVTGQIYQTGADSELLFFGWAMLILPWVLIGRMPWLWLFWIILGNTALLLYVAGRLEIWTLFIFSDSLFWGPLLFNGAALVAWEASWRQAPWLQVRYGPRLIALLATASATVLGVSWWWLGKSSGWRWMHYTPLLYAAWLGVTLWYYQQGRRDIVPLAAGVLSVICVAVAGTLKHLNFRSSFAFDFLLLGMVVAALTALAAVWLRRIAASWEAAE